MSEVRYFDKSFDEIFEKAWPKFCKHREDHEFRHFNNSLNMFIYSKEHMKYEMKKRRMLPIEVCEDLACEWDRRNPHKSYDSLSPKAQEIISSLKLSADRHGNLKLGGRAIKALQEIGAISRTPEFMGTTGGFN